MDFVRLPLMLSFLTAGLFYVWPQEIASGFDDMMNVIKILARPVHKQEVAAVKPQTQEQTAQAPVADQPAASIEWTNYQTLDKDLQEKNQEIAKGLAEESAEQAKQNRCRKAQEDYIDDPSEDNKSALGLACETPIPQ